MQNATVVYLLQRGVQEEEEEERTESDDGREVGESRVADALRDGEAGDGDAGEEVVLELVEAVVRRPLERRHEVLERAPGPGLGRERAEAAERVVGEEGLREARPQRLHEGPSRREVHPFAVVRHRHVVAAVVVAGRRPHVHAGRSGRRAGSGGDQIRSESRDGDQEWKPDRSESASDLGVCVWLIFLTPNYGLS